MKILITGASGFVGRNLVKFLSEKNYDILVTSRQKPSNKSPELENATVIQWNPLEDLCPAEALKDTSVVINLMGAPIDKYWSKSYKAKIWKSRILGTRHLIEGIYEHAPHSVKTIISASAIGYYGDRGDELLTESSSPGKGFLSDVCQAWEKEIYNCYLTNIRCVTLRLGLVLGKNGGVLPTLIPIYRRGLGGTMGSGRQWVSWIHVNDVLQIIYRVINEPKISGPLNVVSPQPLIQKDFSVFLRKVLGVQIGLPCPTLAAQMVLGERSHLILDSQKVKPEKLMQNQFKFAFTYFDDAVRDLV